MDKAPATVADKEKAKLEDARVMIRQLGEQLEKIGRL